MGEELLVFKFDLSLYYASRIHPASAQPQVFLDTFVVNYFYYHDSNAYDFALIPDFSYKASSQRTGQWCFRGRFLIW
jgi:hypothetical protein